jgi:DNA-binding NarL/FixJ family response regulator
MRDGPDVIVSRQSNGAQAFLLPTEQIARTQGTQDKSTDGSQVLVVDRHEFSRNCLVSWLQNSCPEFEVLPASSADRGFKTELHGLPSAAILADDISERRIEWIEQQSALLRAWFPELPIVMIIRTEKASSLAAACNRLGLRGYIPTSTNAAVAAAAVRLIVAGGTYFPRSPGRDLPPKRHRATAHEEMSEPVAFATAKRLSVRELAVVNLIRRGMQNKIIAYELNISVSTVKAHMHRIIRKLNVRNRTELAVMARTINSPPEMASPMLGEEIAP